MRPWPPVKDSKESLFHYFSAYFAGKNIRHKNSKFFSQFVTLVSAGGAR